MIVDEVGNCKGLLIVKDMDKVVVNLNVVKDDGGCLCVVVVLMVGDVGFECIVVLIEVGVDVVIIDMVYGYLKVVGEVVFWVKKIFNLV